MSGQTLKSRIASKYRKRLKHTTRPTERVRLLQALGRQREADELASTLLKRARLTTPDLVPSRSKE